MNFCHFTILIIISNLTIGRCRTVTYNNVGYDNHKIQNNQTRKLNEYQSNLQNQDNVGKSLRNSIKMLQLNNLDNKTHIRDPSQLLKYLNRYQIRKKNSPYTLAIFKDEKSKNKFPSHTLALIKPYAEASKEKYPSHTLAIFGSNPDSNHVQLTKPFKLNLTGDQFILPEIEEDTREGEVFLNNAVVQDLLANSETNDNTYQVDESLKQEYYTINENEIYSFPSNDSSYFPESYQFDDQHDDNFTGYPESHQLTSSTTTEQSDHFNGYFYHAPTYLPPVENGVILQEFSNNNFISNDTEVVKVKQQDLFAHYYIGYKFWYAFVVFAIYHTIMMGYFYLVTLVKHYSKFPAALHAAIANS
ncbi:uncharacterized protein LOC135836195 [Planococcus citri]|uniref:uncharacterized protein LOC135836195 n=1 Tax=Planococcus citri TaxID=170843 RepID=UPI0031F9CD5A